MEIFSIVSPLKSAGFFYPVLTCMIRKKLIFRILCAVFAFIGCSSSPAEGMETSKRGSEELIVEADSKGRTKERISVTFPECRVFVASVLEGVDPAYLSAGIVISGFRAGYLKPEGFFKEMLFPGRYLLLDTLALGRPSFSVNSSFSRGGYPGLWLSGGPWGVFLLIPEDGSAAAGSSLSLAPWTWLSLDLFACMREGAEAGKEESWIVPERVLGRILHTGARFLFDLGNLSLSLAGAAGIPQWSPASFYARGHALWKTEVFKFFASVWSCWGLLPYPDGSEADAVCGYALRFSSEEKRGLSFTLNARGELAPLEPYPEVFQASGDSLSLSLLYRSGILRLGFELCEEYRVEASGPVVSEMSASAEPQISVGDFSLWGRGRVSRDTDGNSAWKGTLGFSWEGKTSGVDASLSVLSEGDLKTSGRLSCEVRPKPSSRLYLRAESSEVRLSGKTWDEFKKSPFSILSLTLGFSCETRRASAGKRE